MINVDLQKIYNSVKYHNTEKWAQPIKVYREEKRDNKQNDAKNRQQISYQEILNTLTDSLTEKNNSHFFCTV